MRVGLDIRDADPASPGQQRYLWRLGAWLAEGGHDVRYLTVRPQRADVRLPPGTTLERLDTLSGSAARARVESMQLDAFVVNPERARHYRGLRPNVLRAAYGTDHYRQKLRSFAGPAERALRHAVRLTPWELAERRWERAFYESPGPPPHVIAQSQYMRREILDTYRVAPERVHVIHNAVDTVEFAPAARLARRDAARAQWGFANSDCCLLFLGHNFRLKGLWQILRALRAVDGARLLVAGRGTGAAQRREAEAQVRRLGLRERVTLAGAVPASAAYAAADALLHITWHDSFGFVVLEAMACGLSVVTTPYAGAAELIEPGASGLIVDPGNEDALVAAMRSLVDPSTRERLGRRAAAAAAPHDEVSNFRAVERVLVTAGCGR